MTLAEYDTYMATIDAVEQIEEDVIKDGKLRRCCFYSLELLKIGISYLKNSKNNINGQRKTEGKNKTQ